MPFKADENLFARLSENFAKNEVSIQRALEARSADRLRNLQNTLENQKQQEIKNIVSVLDELSRTIENEIRKEHEPEQLALFTEDERTQVRRDTEALKARLARIPEEEEQEIQAIEHRYRDFLPLEPFPSRLFSCARVSSREQCRMSDLSQHGEWLSLIDVSGPFLAEPVLKQVLPQGLEQIDPLNRKAVRQAYEEWREAIDLDDPQLPAFHKAWVELVLKRVLELDEDNEEDILKPRAKLSDALTHLIPEHGVTLRPDFAVVDEQNNNQHVCSSKFFLTI